MSRDAGASHDADEGRYGAVQGFTFRLGGCAEQRSLIELRSCIAGGCPRGLAATRHIVTTGGFVDERGLEPMASSISSDRFVDGRGLEPRRRTISFRVPALASSALAAPA